MIKLPEPKVLRREPAEMTRAALVQAALKLFGRQGFDGTSTREIAAEARANI
ncbi:TetR family transcriptional regulator, partial [Mesorhizobium sp. M7A.F.Ca.US.001.02.1.1]